MSAEEFFASSLGLRDKNIISELACLSSRRSVRQGDFLLKEGECQQEMLFLIDGVIRFFYIDVNGQEITDCFIAEPGIPIMARPRLNLPSAVYVEAATDSELIGIAAAGVDSMLQRHSELLRIYNRLIMDILDMHWEIKTVVCGNTAMQRYEWFLKKYPGLIDRISHKHIASFLQITPVTLSRLRRVLREQRQGTPD